MRLAREEGASLVIAVMVLVLLTIIGLGGVLRSSLTMESSSNIRKRMQTFRAAESCLYLQIRNIKTSGAATGALGTQNLSAGYTCTASAPVASGGGVGGTTLDGYSLESGSASISYASYQFQVNGFGPGGVDNQIDVIVNLPVASGGY